MSEKHRAFGDYIARRIDEVAVEEDIALEHAWPKVAAEVLGYDIDALDFLTGRDAGLDFYVISGSVYVLTQCKMHEVADDGSITLGDAFDERGVVDLERSFRVLVGGELAGNVDQRIERLAARLQEEMGLLSEDEGDGSTRISIIFKLVTLGDKLTPRAKTEMKNFKSQLREFDLERPGLSLNFEHVGISELATFFEDPEYTPAPPQDSIRLSVAYQTLALGAPEDGAIRANNCVTFYTRATDLVNASVRSGPGLFDANVRYELKSSNINEDIRQYAMHTKSMKLFHLYNNGVAIVASGWSKKKNGAELEIKAPAVINGCQTVRSLVAARKTLEERAEKEEYALKRFDETCMVLVRLMRRNAVNIEEIVRTANTQNPMEPRNLLGNRPEQRALEREFSHLGWFYERKDGSRDALIDADSSSLGVPLATFQHRTQRRGRKVLRTCDNRNVARAWLSFIGLSDEGKNERKKHFNETPTGLYRTVFHEHPLSHLLVAQMEDTPQDQVLVEGRPPGAWMLVATHILRLVKAILPVATRLRAKVRRQLVEANTRVTTSKINDRIMEDEELRLRFALSMLDHVVVELAGFTIYRALDNNWLSPAQVNSILGKGALKTLHETGQIPPELSNKSVFDLAPDCVSEDPVLLAIRLGVRGISATLSKPEFEDGFRSAERRSRYLQSDQLRREYARSVDRYDRYFSQSGHFEDWWQGGSPYSAIEKMLSDG